MSDALRKRQATIGLTHPTPLAVADLEEARVALGYQEINLYGTPYGTLLALQYLRQKPDRIAHWHWPELQLRRPSCRCTTPGERRMLWIN